MYVYTSISILFYVAACNLQQIVKICYWKIDENPLSTISVFSPYFLSVVWKHKILHNKIYTEYLGHTETQIYLLNYYIMVLGTLKNCRRYDYWRKIRHIDQELFLPIINMNHFGDSRKNLLNSVIQSNWKRTRVCVSAWIGWSAQRFSYLLFLRVDAHQVLK